MNDVKRILAEEDKRLDDYVRKIIEDPPKHPYLQLPPEDTSAGLASVPSADKGWPPPPLAHIPGWTEEYRRDVSTPAASAAYRAAIECQPETKDLRRLVGRHNNISVLVVNEEKGVPTVFYLRADNNTTTAMFFDDSSTGMTDAHMTRLITNLTIDLRDLLVFASSYENLVLPAPLEPPTHEAR